MALFDIADSLGSKSNEDIGAYLTSINDFENAQHFIGANVAGQGGAFHTRAWKHHGSVFGFINDTPDPTSGLFLIHNASAIQPDTSLVGQSIKISLDCFYVHSYPGYGAHNVLFDFGGKSQINANLEDIRHPLKFRINDQANASVNGTPIFLGLNVNQNGVSFEGRTINVDSSDDQQIIALFESSVFKTGLTLVNTAQPVLKPYSALAVAAISAIAARSRNVQVHNFNLGLDFGTSATSCKLRHGSYLVIQSDDAINLDNYRWNRTTARLEHFPGSNEAVGFNYLIVGVSAYHP